jgi:hypothetical protein
MSMVSPAASRETGQSTAKVPKEPEKSRDSTSLLPPSNIPPPSILISLLVTYIQGLSVPAPTSSRGATSQDGSDSTMRDLISTLRVASRILAGRKLRWKRDKHLTQSMSIGPAGKPGGMKLVSVDRAEAQREDREAAEFVRSWKQKQGSVRSALAKVGSSADGQPTMLPTISETMMVRTMKASEGGITAPKCCVLCGLKRDERVDKVDGEVWDTFDEWWTTHWGHTGCRTFWQMQEELLKKR